MSRLPGKGAEGFRTLRRYGQNFLVDRGVLEDIVRRAAIGEEDVVLEIGPGQGVLTRALLERGCAHLHAVELDERLRPYLEGLASREPRLSLYWGDALRMDCGALSPFPRKVVANIPYNITTPLIWSLLRLGARGLRHHLYMVQKEAADRLTASADTKERYPLGVALEVMGAVERVRRVPPSCFRPRPRVDSEVIEIVLSRNFHLMEDGLWSGLLHRAFAQRRKTLFNNLKGFEGLEDWEGRLREAGIDPRSRAEDLEGDAWLSLYGTLRTRLGGTAVHPPEMPEGPPCGR